MLMVWFTGTKFGPEHLSWNHNHDVMSYMRYVITDAEKLKLKLADIFKFILLNENSCILIEISLRFPDVQLTI